MPSVSSFEVTFCDNSASRCFISSSEAGTSTWVSTDIITATSPP